MDEQVAMEFAADTAQAVASVRELATSAQALADTAKEAADGVAGITEPATAAGDAIKTVADASASADTALTANATAAKDAAAGYDGLATSAKAAADDQTAAAGKSDAAAGAAAEGGLAKYKMALVGVGIGAAVAVDGAAKYQAETTRLVTSAGEATGNLDMVRNGMLALSSQTDESTSELSSGMYLVESAGFHGASGLTVLKAAAQGAKDEGAELSTVANGVTDALTDFHLPATDAANVTSQLIAGVSRGKTTFEEFSGSMSTILPLASSLHLSLSDVTGVLAEMTAHGVGARQAADDEANAMRELMKPNAAMTTEWTKMGITAKEVNDKLGTAGLAGTMQWMSGVARDGASAIGQTYNQALGKMVGTAPALQVALMTTGENATATASAIKAIGSATADAQGNVDGFSTVSQTASFKLGAAKEAVEAMGISLGEALLPAVMAVLGPITHFLTLIASNHAAAIAFAVVIGSLLAGALGVKLAGALKDASEGIKAAGEGIEWLIGKMTASNAATEANAAATEALTAAKEESVGATEAATAAQGELDVAMDANPIGLIIVAVAALIAIFVLLITHVHDVAHVFDVMRHDIAAAVDDVVSFVKDHWQLLATILATVLLGPVGGLVVFLATHWKQVTADISKLISDITGFFTSLPAKFVQWGEDIINGLIHGIEAAVGSLLSTVSSIGSDISSAFSSVLGIFSPSRVFYEHGRNTMQGYIDGVKAMAGAAQGAVAGVGGNIASVGVAGAIGPAGGGGTTVHVTAPMTVQAGSGYDTPQFQQYLQAAVQEATLRYSQLNPTNGLTQTWGR